MNASKKNSPSVPTTNTTTTNSKGAINMENVVIALKKGERVEIEITSKEMHGDKLLTFARETFGAAANISRHEVYGEKVFLDVASLLGYNFEYSYRTGRVGGGTKGGTKFGTDLGASAARIENTVGNVTAWVQSDENGTILVLKFRAHQFAIEVLEEVAAFFLGKVEDAKAANTKTQTLSVIEDEIWEIRETAYGDEVFVSALEEVHSFEEAKRITHARSGVQHGEAEVVWVSEPRVIRADLQGDIIEVEFHEVEVKTLLWSIEGFGIFASDREPMDFIGTYEGVVKYVEKVIGASVLA